MKRLVLSGSGLVGTTLATLFLALSAFGGTRDVPPNPFSYLLSSESDGPGSGLWGDGALGPSGVHLGCIPGRHWALAIVVENGTGQALTILSVGGSQPHGRVIRRVAVQARLKPPVLAGDHLVHSGLRTWSSKPSQPLTVPANSDAWLQLNFVMGKCSLVKSRGRLVVSDRLTITYHDSSGVTGRGRTAPIVPIILKRASRAQIAAYRASSDAG